MEGKEEGVKLGANKYTESQPIGTAAQMSKKRKFVADRVFFAELNEVLTRELAEDGYSGVEVRVTPIRTEIIIRATRTQNVLGEKGRRIRELTSVVQKRFKFPEGNGVAESLRYKLLGGLAVRSNLREAHATGKQRCLILILPVYWACYDSKGAGTRAYSYRVLMHTGDAELEMRGRCSAG
ncbi:hypothetical protein ACSBR2_038212 [Camellia fascicularis]